MMHICICEILSSLVRVVACHPFYVMPLHELNPNYCHLNPWGQTLANETYENYLNSLKHSDKVICEIAAMFIGLNVWTHVALLHNYDWHLRTLW